MTASQGTFFFIEKSGRDYRLHSMKHQDFAPENRWLEDYNFLFGRLIFKGYADFCRVSGRVVFIRKTPTCQFLFLGSQKIGIKSPEDSCDFFG